MSSDTLSMPQVDTEQDVFDLEKEAIRLGVSHFLACWSSLQKGMTSVIVPVSNARDFQQIGVKINCSNGLTTSPTEMRAVPVATTMVQIPWLPKTAYIACELFQDGKPSNLCPRHALKNVLKAANERGLEIKTSVEFEFILLKKDEHTEFIENDTELNMYDRRHTMIVSNFIDQIMSCLNNKGWHPEKFEKEGQPSQFEMVLKYCNALDMADKHLAIKFLLKNLAEKEGFRANFMPMPMQGQMGNGMHLNFSFWDVKKGINLSNDAQGTLGLSQIAQHGLAGIMKNLKGLCAIVCPTVNSYKRLHACPNHLRMVAYSQEQVWAPIRTTSTAGDRIEFRLPDGAVNPYLLPASTIAASLFGIDEELELDEKQFFNTPMTEELLEIPCQDFDILPYSLEEACSYLQENHALAEFLGVEMVKGFISIKNKQVREYRKHISKWEMNVVNDY